MHTMATILHHSLSMHLSHLLLVSSVNDSLLLKFEINVSAMAAGHNDFDPPSINFWISKFSLMACGIIIAIY